MTFTVRFYWYRNGKTTRTADHLVHLVPRMGDTVIVEGFQGTVVHVGYNVPLKGPIEIKLG